MIVLNLTWSKCRDKHISKSMNRKIAERIEYISRMEKFFFLNISLKNNGNWLVLSLLSVLAVPEIKRDELDTIIRATEIYFSIKGTCMWHSIRSFNFSNGLWTTLNNGVCVWTTKFSLKRVFRSSSEKHPSCKRGGPAWTGWVSRTDRRGCFCNVVKFLS